MQPLTRLSLATALVLAAAGAPAQQLYRCGNVYSQTPCAPDATPQRARSDSVADAAPGPRGAELCREAATRELQLDDSAPVLIASVTKAPADVIQYADKPTATRPYVVTLRPRGAHVPYNGPSAYTCHLSEDERRVLKFGAR